MAYSENVASLEPWTFRSTFADSLLQVCARDNDALTRTLQVSFSAEEAPRTSDSLSPPFLLTPTDSAVSGSDPEAPPKRHRVPVNGKLSKRKSRASKRSHTTFITADPANFRQMVQQVTGVRFGTRQEVPLPTILKPEPQRPSSCGGRLPTLDTSEFLLDHQQQELASLSFPSSLIGDGGPIPPVGLDSFPSFPTLESWKVM